MRKIDFVEPETDEWKAWLRRCTQARTRAINAVAAGAKPKISELYKGQKALFSAAAGPFRGKCAYCEQRIGGDQHCDIDHFRPKSGAAEEDWSPVTRTVQGVREDHPGYYWLAYDWRNLVLSCVLCNQVPGDRVYGKGHRFPVFAGRAWAPGEEADEHPKLVHPVLDEPADHIGFDEETGLLYGKTPRGWSTIEILGLNLRDLPAARLEAYEDVKARFNQIVVMRGADRAQRLKELRSSERRAFTSVARTAFDAESRSLLADADRLRTELENAQQ